MTIPTNLVETPIKPAPKWGWLKNWETLLVVIFIAVIFINIRLSPFFLSVDNLVNIFQLSVEKVTIALVMTFIIINGEIDLSVAAIMGMCATIFGWLYQNHVDLTVAALITLGIGTLCGAFNGMWIAYFGLPALAVTLAGLVGYRGIGFIFLEEKSVTNFPDSLMALGRSNTFGLPVPATLLLFFALFIVFAVVLHTTAFGRLVYVVGNNKEAARFAGVRVRRLKMTLFTLSGFISALAALIYTARVGTVRANVAEGFELDIITMVVLGGVNIFGGSGSLLGVGLSFLVALSLRNGMTLANINGSVQTSIIGTLLILSVLLPNVFRDAQSYWHRLRLASTAPREEEPTTEKAEAQS